MKKRIKVKMTEAYNALVHTNRKDISEFLEAQKDRAPARSGLFLTDEDEDMPIYNQAPCETVYSRKSDIGHRGGRIVLTKDNYGARSTGLGGAGGTKC